MLLPIETDRLILLPFTKKICEETLNNSFQELGIIGITPSYGWPDADTLDTLPRILNNLNKVIAPSGFESWMVIHKDTNSVIGDIGFKGLPNESGEIDLGYGIITNERRKGYAKEAAFGIIDWAFKQSPVKAITANCSKENSGSQRVLRSLKFETVEEDAEMIFWRLEQVF